jgi:hypothetical protein
MAALLTLTCTNGDTLGPLGFTVSGNFQLYHTINQKCPSGFTGMSAIDDGQGIRSPGWLRWFCPTSQQVGVLLLPCFGA